MNSNTKLLIEQMEAKIARLRNERRELDRRYLGMLTQYGRTTAFADEMKKVDARIGNLRERLQRIREKAG